MTPVNQKKPRVQRVRCFSALSSGLTPPPPMKNARRGAAAGHKTTQRRRRPPVRRRTALPQSASQWHDASADGRPIYSLILIAEWMINDYIFKLASYIDSQN